MSRIKLGYICALIDEEQGLTLYGRDSSVIISVLMRSSQPAVFIWLTVAPAKHHSELYQPFTNAGKHKYCQGYTEYIHSVKVY